MFGESIPVLGGQRHGSRSEPVAGIAVKVGPTRQQHVEIGCQLHIARHERGVVIGMEGFERIEACVA